MAQRVSLARLLAANPEMLLMDEPFASLDAQTRIDMQETLLQIWEHSHKTVLFVTHDIDEALLLSDRVMLMSGRPGRIIETFNVPFIRPRVTGLLFTNEVVALRSRIFGLLRQEQRKSTGHNRTKALVSSGTVRRVCVLASSSRGGTSVTAEFLQWQGADCYLPAGRMPAARPEARAGSDARLLG